MAVHFIGHASEISPGQRKVIKIGRIEIGVFNIGGKFFALPNLCPHQFGPLCGGKLTGAIVADAASDFGPRWEFDGEVVCCPWHGLEFNVTTGRSLAYRTLKLRQYPVTVENDRLSLIV